MPSTVLGTVEASVNWTVIIPPHRTSLMEEVYLKFLDSKYNNSKFETKKRLKYKITQTLEVLLYRVFT